MLLTYRKWKLKLRQLAEFLPLFLSYLHYTVTGRRCSVAMQNKPGSLFRYNITQLRRSVLLQKKPGSLCGYHTDYLRSFALGVIGEIETYKDNKDKLQQMLVRQNRL